MNKLTDEQLIAEICQYLNRSIADLDHNLAAQLDAARESAVASAQAVSVVTKVKATGLQDQELIDSVVSAMDADSAVPTEIEQKLNKIRRQAISRLDEKQSTDSLLTESMDWLARILQPLSDSLTARAPMIATACLTVTVASVFYMSTLSDSNISVEDEILLVASADDLELYENLDFYLWLEEIEQTN